MPAVCLSVCLSKNRITQKVDTELDENFWINNFWDRDKSRTFTATEATVRGLILFFPVYTGTSLCISIKFGTMTHRGKEKDFRDWQSVPYLMGSKLHGSPSIHRSLLGARVVIHNTFQCAH